MVEDAQGVYRVEIAQKMQRAKKSLVACKISKTDRKGQNVPGSTTDLGQSELDTPDLTLVAKTVLADALQLRVPKLGVNGAFH